MTEYWVNPAIGSDSNDGSANDASNAWATLQKAADSWAAGDIINLVSAGSGNDETPTVEIDIDGTTGTAASPIIVRGVNSSGVEDGTRYIIDGGSLGSGLSLMALVSTCIFVAFKNIEFNNAKDDAVEMPGFSSYPFLFLNCVFHGATNDGIGTYVKGVCFVRCMFSSNGGHGFYRPGNACSFLFCVFKDNGSAGCRFYHSEISFIHCIFHNNGGAAGLHSENLPPGAIFGCIFDGNTVDGLTLSTSVANLFLPLAGNRFTNNAVGIDYNDTNSVLFEDYNFFLNNTTNLDGSTILSGDNSLTTGTEGYNDRANDDFGLTSSATLRRTEVKFP